MIEKIHWRGVLTSVQPRIRLTRSYDQRQHTYLGYVLTVDGTIGDEARAFLVAVGTGAQAKHALRVGDRVSGEGLPVPDPDLETAELYKVTRLEVRHAPQGRETPPPPWHGMPPALPDYRERGHRRLDARTLRHDCPVSVDPLFVGFSG